MSHIELKSSVRDRLKHLMEIYEVDTSTAFAALTGVPQKTIRGILRRDAIGPKSARQIAQTLNIAYKWLKTGEGTMGRPVPEPCPPPLIASVGPREKTHGINTNHLIAPPPLEVNFEEFVFMRRTKTKLSGAPGLIPEEGYTAEPYAFRGSWLESLASRLDNVVLMEIVGDSMAPTLQNGNMALVDLGKCGFKPGKLFAIRHADIIQIKRLDISPTGIIRIYSDNPLYGREECTPEELHIIGQLIWSARIWI